MNPAQISKGYLYTDFLRTIAKPAMAFIFILSLLFSPLSIMAAIGIPQPTETSQ